MSAHAPRLSLLQSVEELLSAFDTSSEHLIEIIRAHTRGVYVDQRAVLTGYIAMSETNRVDVLADGVHVTEHPWPGPRVAEPIRGVSRSNQPLCDLMLERCGHLSIGRTRELPQHQPPGNETPALVRCARAVLQGAEVGVEHDRELFDPIVQWGRPKLGQSLRCLVSCRPDHVGLEDLEARVPHVRLLEYPQIEAADLLRPVAAAQSGASARVAGHDLTDRVDATAANLVSFIASSSRAYCPGEGRARVGTPSALRTR